MVKGKGREMHFEIFNWANRGARIRRLENSRGGVFTRNHLAQNPRARIHQNQKCFDHDIKRFNPKKIKSKHSNKVFRGTSDFDRTNCFLDSLTQIKSPLEKFFRLILEAWGLIFKN